MGAMDDAILSLLPRHGNKVLFDISQSSSQNEWNEREGQAYFSYTIHRGLHPIIGNGVKRFA